MLHEYEIEYESEHEKEHENEYQNCSRQGHSQKQPQPETATAENNEMMR